MVAVQLSRLAAEVVSDAGSQMSVTRLDCEVLSDADSGTSAARVSRLTCEVVAKRPAVMAVTRLDVEVLSDADSGTSAVQLSRLTGESVMVAPRHAAVTRLDVEVLSDSDSGTSAVQLSRLTAEAVFRRGSSDPVVPLPLPDNADLFVHNWANQVTMRQAYDTRISASGITGAESRRGVVLKPSRELTVVWESGSRDVLDRLYVKLRRITNSRSVVPLYQHQRPLLADATALDSTILVDTTKARFNIGARVVIVERDYKGRPVSHSYHLIATKADGSLTFEDPLGVAVSAGSFVVMPCMDCETIMAASMSKRQGCHGRVEITLAEVAGPSALNPIKADTPSGAFLHDGTPIFHFDPNWIQEVEVGRSLQGSLVQQGTTVVVDAEAERSRQTHRFYLSGETEEMFSVLEHFDTRRGRLRRFWLIDQEFVFNAVQIDAAGEFIDFEEFGDFDDFADELEGGWIGLVMRNGDVYVREAVTVQDLGNWQVAVSPDLPAGLDAADVVRVARARSTRFAKDEIEERWFHNCAMEVDVETIETLEEKVVDL